MFGLNRCQALLFLMPLLVALPARAADPVPDGDAAALATTIDKLVADRWAAAKAQPAPAADDAEFLRRTYLDLTGKIPSVAETRDFLQDKRPDKRRRLVERLLRSSGYVDHFTHVWRGVFLGEKDSENLGLRFGFEAWLRSRLQENARYDRLVREILTVPLARPRTRALALAEAGGQQGPFGFYLANENKPENLAGSTARLFLGVRLECAQCHAHPFARWTREQFWEYAAFFGDLGQRGKPREITIPNLNKVVKARFIDGAEPNWKDGTDPRATLADWMLARDNPYFARATVNRIWAYFFGIGLVEPVDDLTQETEKNALLDELSEQFARHGYDLKYLIRAIVTSKAYGLSSQMTHPSQEDPRLFARMQVRGLAPEQLFDSLAEATRQEEGMGQARAEFLARFANSAERSTEIQTSILQALALMNGKYITDATSLHRSATLQAVSDAPFLDPAEQVEALYLAALTRKPRPDESARLVSYINRGGPTGDRKQALADVFWALLNSSEFLFNH